MPFGELEVYVEGALGIKDTGIFGKSSPYCVLTCGAQQSKTPIAQDAGSNPYWNSTFMFKIDRSCQELGIKIYCHNTLSADDELAYTRYAVYNKRFAQLSTELNFYKDSSLQKHDRRF
jgi:Ca2+-dependent lipid-binding protein